MTPAPQAPTQTYEDAVNIDDLEPHPDNPRLGDVDAIAGSVKANGFYGTVIAWRPDGPDGPGQILAGHHRLLAAQQAGLDTVPVVWLDGIDEDRARAIMLVDNRSGDLADYDTRQLAVALAKLAEADEDLLEAALWDDVEGQRLLAQLEDGILEDDLAALDADDPGDPQDDEPAGDGADEFPEVDPDAEVAHRCPQCLYEWDGICRPPQSADFDDEADGDEADG